MILRRMRAMLEMLQDEVRPPVTSPPLSLSVTNTQPVNAPDPAICTGSTSPPAGHGRVQMDQSGQPYGLGPRPASRLVVMQTSYGLVPVGWVQSALRVPGDAPHQREGAPRAWIRFDEQVAEGAKDLRPGDEIVVLTWLHLARRDELATHPQGDMSRPLTGVFSTCSPNRPNPVGLHCARIVARAGLRIEVDALEAVDGTPVVDVKPAIDRPA
jgi:tRNA-Thr(GGU) m(6)t(6)A37 methyltransferase TsaA